MLTWKYTLPAFLVPFAFTLSAEGTSLLLQGVASTILRTALTAAVGIAAFAGAFGGWILRRASVAERGALAIAGAMLLFGDVRLDLAGFALIVVVLFLHWLGRPR